MLKFEYHYLENKLFTQTFGQPPQEIPQSFANEYGGKGFILQPINHWINFTVYSGKIRAFYKQVQPNLTDEKEIITYYRKDLEKANPIIFTFTPTDQVQKVHGSWVKKYA